MRAAGIEWTNIAEALNINDPGMSTPNLRGNLDLNDVLTDTGVLTP